MSEDLFPGLPEDLMEFTETEVQETSSISISLEKRKYGKLWATISNLNMPKDNLKVLLKFIKNKLASAGTIKKQQIEILFGRSDKSKDLINLLVEYGFERDSITVKK